MAVIDGKEMDYMGDGVYVIFDGQGFWLHANDHANPTDKIYLEPGVWENLSLWISQRVRKWPRT